MSSRRMKGMKSARDIPSKKVDWPRLCLVCSTYVNGSELRNHMKSHAGKINHQCPYCFDFIKSNDMPSHMKTHKGEKPYSCINCKFRCKSKTMLKFHKRREHNWEDQDENVVTGDPEKDSDECDEFQIDIPPNSSNEIDPLIVQENHNIETQQEVFHDSNDSTDDSEASTSFQQNVQTYYCQLCFTTVSSDALESHKCISSFNRSDYHFFLRDRHFETLSEAQTSDILQSEIPQVDTLTTPRYQTPETVFCGICSSVVNVNHISQHMTYHGLIRDEENSTWRPLNEQPNYKLSILDRQLPQGETSGLKTEY